MSNTIAVERRMHTSNIFVRSAGTKTFVEGHAAVYRMWSQDLGGFRERLMPGCFEEPLAEKQDIVCLFNHDPNFPLGKTTARTLSVSSDARGLYFRVELPNTTAGRDLAESIRRGDVSGASFGFAVADGGDEWGEDEENGVRFVSRTLRKIRRIFDTSPVVYPAYQQTDANISALTPASVSSFVVSPRALVEARSRGGIVLVRPRTDNGDAERRRRSEEIRRLIAADERRD